ncbi:MAG: hypothetical protein DRO04_02975 [Candidatus Iainarchaeum archaeon]|uniref:Uncharacterized protein n=1 Tax=Candidatus Iainarchaeum sp. TaxID=3101447 RepID=A0A497JFM6_9ARCH|nr:MAG: hypothetical protein DRO04_02975 [Candidatus Diapherotrites archaeon]
MPYSKKGVTLFIMEMLFLAAFWIFMLIEVVKINYKTFSISFSNEGFDYFILFTLAVLVVIFHYLLNKKYPEEAKLRYEVTQLYKERLSQKIKSAKSDVRIVAMVVLEFSAIIVVALGLYGLFEKVSIISGAVPPIIRKLLIAVILILFIYGYWRFMKPFYKYRGYYYVKKKRR